MLTIVPVDLDEANTFCREHHRHNHGRIPAAKFAVAAADDSAAIIGVAIVGKPVARLLDDGWTLCVHRVCTIGERNACSLLYGAAWRVTRNLGYHRLITYTLTTEPGTSLRAAGWKCIGEAGGGTWNRRARPRVDKHPLQKKLIWEQVA